MSNSAREYAVKGLSLAYLGFWLVVSISVNLAVADDSRDATPLGKLQVRDSKDQALAEWDREKAIEFAFQQSAKVIDYVFVASVAVIGFVVKSFIIDLDASKEGAKWKRDWLGCVGRSLVVAVLVIFGTSVMMGIFAYGQFPHLATKESFSLYGDTGFYAGLQVVLFGIGALALLSLCVLRLFGLIVEKEN